MSVIAPPSAAPPSAAPPPEPAPARARHRRPRLPAAWIPVLVLVALDVLVLRRLLFTSEVPAGMDSGFLYSMLPVFEHYHLGSFTTWLPAPFGQVQQYSIYWFLAMLDAVVGAPMLVYKAAVLGALLAASLGVYGLARWLTGSRPGALAAGILYTLAPISVAQLTAGHLNVSISYAVGPLAVWAAWAAARDGSRAAAVGLGLCGSVLFLLTTGQGLYWALPIGLVVAAELVAAARAGRARAALRRAGSAGAIAFGVLLVTSAVQVVPTLAGLRAPFTSSGDLYISQLAIHAKYSLPFLDGVLGVPREQYVNGSVHLALSGYDGVPYRLAAWTLVALATAALFTRRGRAAAPLAAAAVVAWVLAAGPDGPGGALYGALYAHVPFFKLLRVPNRWIMVSGLSAALLAAMTVDALARGGLHPERARLAAWGTAIVAVLCGGYAVFAGVPTWRLPSDYSAAYGRLGERPGDWRTLTTPFYQSWMNGGDRLATDLRLVSDLGYTSTWWTGRPTVGRGGWDPRASTYAGYLYDLVRQGTNRETARLLAPAGIRYVALDPHGAEEVVPGQNDFWEHQRGLRPVTRAGRVRILRVPGARPPVFSQRRACVVVGGYSVLGDLALSQSFDFRRTGVLFASQIAEEGGPAALRRMLRATRCLIVAGDQGPELRRLLAGAASVPLTTQAPREWSRSTTHPIADLTADPTTTVDVPPRGVAHGTLEVRHGGVHRVWIDALRAPDQPALALRVDGRPAGVLRLRSAYGRAMAWTGGRPLRLAAGSHRYELRNLGTGAGDFVEASAVSVMPAVAPAPPAGVRIYRGVSAVPAASAAPPALAGRLSGRWRPEPSAGHVAAARLADGGLRLAVARGGRPRYTLARARLRRPVDPDRILAVPFRGTASGETVYLNVLFDRRGRRKVSYRFQDTSRRPRLLLVSPQQPDIAKVTPRWDAAREVTLSTNAKAAWRGAATVGPLMTTSRVLRPGFGDARGAGPGATSPAAGGTLGSDTLRGDRVALRGRAAPGFVTFTQSFHPRWALSGSGAAAHVPGFGFANTYWLPHGGSPHELRFTGAVYGRVGNGISTVAFLLCGLGLLATWARRRRRS